MKWPKLSTAFALAGLWRLTGASTPDGALAAFIASLDLASPVDPSQFATAEELACKVLQLRGTSKGWFSGSATVYDALRGVNWAQNSWLLPKCIVQPVDVDDVAAVVKVLSNTGAKFAVRSGGHSPNVGWANINEGVLIDMVKISETTYDADAGSVVVGSGRRWVDVYKDLEPDGVMVVGGRVPPVGVGGLLLGGGLSYISNKYGTPGDNILSYEVVTAAGEIIYANASSNPELFWALKGGASNFGIVPRFTLKAVPLPEFWAGFLAFKYEQAPAVLEALAAYQNVPDAEFDPNAELCVQFFPNNDTILAHLVYSKPEAWPKAYAMFRPLVTKSFANTIKVQSFLAYVASQPWGEINRYDTKTASVKVDVDLYKEALAIAEEEAAALKPANAGSLLFVFQPISENVVEQGTLNGGNPYGLEKTKQTWLGTVGCWNLEEDDDLAYQVTKKIIARIDALAESKNARLPYRFMNDAGYDQDVLASYGEENLQKMKEIAKKFDPEGVFQQQIPGGFKLDHPQVEPKKAKSSKPTTAAVKDEL